MFVQQRMLAARVAMKSRSQKEYLQGLGIEIVYEDNSTKIGGERKNEKECNYRNNEPGKRS